MKLITLNINNTTPYDFNFVLFDALKNPTRVKNNFNQMQNSSFLSCVPLNSFEGLQKLRTPLDIGLAYFDQSGNLVFSVQKLSSEIGKVIVSTPQGSYLQLLESLKEKPIKIMKAHVVTNLPSVAPENWQILKTFENGEQNIELLTNTQTITPQTVNTTIGLFNINKTIDRYTGAVISIRAGENKIYTFDYL